MVWPLGVAGLWLLPCVLPCIPHQQSLTQSHSLLPPGLICLAVLCVARLQAVAEGQAAELDVAFMPPPTRAVLLPPPSQKAPQVGWRRCHWPWWQLTACWAARLACCEA